MRNLRYPQGGHGPDHVADHLTLDSKFLACPACCELSSRDDWDRFANSCGWGMKEGAAPRRGSARPGASLAWGGRFVSSYAPNSFLPPLPRARPPLPPRSQLGKSSEAPAPVRGRREQAALSARGCPRQLDRSPRGADNPGACSRGRGGPSCQGDPGGRGEGSSSSARPDGQAGGGDGTMSCRKRSFTFGAYGG